ncbi:MAG: hypothetical protein AAGG02_20355, partial [Cyanobacteria bacterium P01_H01_bin.15]
IIQLFFAIYVYKKMINFCLDQSEKVQKQVLMDYFFLRKRMTESFIWGVAQNPFKRRRIQQRYIIQTLYPEAR